ncbi:MAG: CBS domain-containing protein [Methanimicrococcus sp.]|nr:CBS domain-containing protein [Methanimicrococcus sp.]
MKMKNIMSSPVYVVMPDDTIAYARNLMMKHKVGSILVVDNEKLVGIFTKSDLKNRLFEGEAAWKRRPIDQIPVSSVCSADVITMAPNMPIVGAAKIMADQKIDHIPVVDKEIFGIVSKTDIIQHVSELGAEGRVKDIMSGQAVTVNVSHTLNHIIHEMERNRVQKVIVMDNNEKAVGIISIKDLSANELIDSDGKRSIRGSKKEASKESRFAIDVPFIAEDIMTNIVVADVSESVSSAAQKIIKNNVISLPVTQNGKVVGMISKDDIVAWLSQQEESV